MTTVDDLPEDVLAQVFQNLNVREKMISQLVCRSWRDVLQHPKVLAGTCLCSLCLTLRFALR